MKSDNRKRNRNLASAMHAASRSATAAPVVGSRAVNREGKRQIAGWFSHEAWKQVRTIALDETTSVQALLEEALNDLFNKRGKAPIA